MRATLLSRFLAVVLLCIPLAWGMAAVARRNLDQIQKPPGRIPSARPVDSNTGLLIADGSPSIQDRSQTFQDRSPFIQDRGPSFWDRNP